MENDNAESPGTLVVSVGVFTARLAQVFRRVKSFERLGISGEISNWRPRASGVNFRLTEGTAVLDCFAYTSVAKKFPALESGLHVVAYGSVQIYPLASTYQLLVDAVVPSGTGELYLRQQKLKELFAREGLFDAARKRAIPRFITSVALVSARAQGADDFEDSIRKSAPHVRVFFVETRLQGVGAEVEIADALDRASRLQVDAIALVRGGGSYEDRFPFNLEPVVRAIARAKHPVITGIGHTSDHHLADDVADQDAHTPSRAAEFIVERWKAGSAELDDRVRALAREIKRVLSHAAQRLQFYSGAMTGAATKSIGRRTVLTSALLKRLDAKNPQRELSARNVRALGLIQRLDQWPVRAQSTRRERLAADVTRLATGFTRIVSARERALERGVMRLNALDPFQPLERGYAMILMGDRVVRDASELAAGDGIAARMARGTVLARVESVDLHE